MRFCRRLAIVIGPEPASEVLVRPERTAVIPNRVQRPDEAPKAGFVLGSELAGPACGRDRLGLPPGPLRLVGCLRRCGDGAAAQASAGPVHPLLEVRRNLGKEHALEEVPLTELERLSRLVSLHRAHHLQRVAPQCARQKLDGFFRPGDEHVGAQVTAEMIERLTEGPAGFVPTRLLGQNRPTSVSRRLGTPGVAIHR